MRTREVSTPCCQDFICHVIVSVMLGWRAVFFMCALVMGCYFIVGNIFSVRAPNSDQKLKVFLKHDLKASPAKWIYGTLFKNENNQLFLNCTQTAFPYPEAPFVPPCDTDKLPSQPPITVKRKSKLKVLFISNDSRIRNRGETPSWLPGGTHHRLPHFWLGPANIFTYCHLNGYDYVIGETSVPGGYIQNWGKVFLMRALLESHPEYDYYVAFDSDSFVYNYNMRFEELMERITAEYPKSVNSTVIVGSEPHRNCWKAYPEGAPECKINSGIIIYRNGNVEKTKRISDAWIDSANRWPEAKNRWPAEQGSFGRVAAEFKDDFTVLPLNELFNYPCGEWIRNYFSDHPAFPFRSSVGVMQVLSFFTSGIFQDPEMRKRLEEAGNLVKRNLKVPDFIQSNCVSDEINFFRNLKREVSRCWSIKRHSVADDDPYYGFGSQKVCDIDLEYLLTPIYWSVVNYLKKIFLMIPFKSIDWSSNPLKIGSTTYLDPSYFEDSTDPIKF